MRQKVIIIEVFQDMMYVHQLPKEGNSESIKISLKETCTIEEAVHRLKSIVDVRHLTRIVWILTGIVTQRKEMTFQALDQEELEKVVHYQGSHYLHRKHEKEGITYKIIEEQEDPTQKQVLLYTYEASYIKKYQRIAAQLGTKRVTFIERNNIIAMYLGQSFTGYQLVVDTLTQQLLVIKNQTCVRVEAIESKQCALALSRRLYFYQMKQEDVPCYQIEVEEQVVSSKKSIGLEQQIFENTKDAGLQEQIFKNTEVLDLEDKVTDHKEDTLIERQTFVDEKRIEVEQQKAENKEYVEVKEQVFGNRENIQENETNVGLRLPQLTHVSNQSLVIQSLEAYYLDEKGIPKKQQKPKQYNPYSKYQYSVALVLVLFLCLSNLFFSTRLEKERKYIETTIADTVTMCFETQQAESSNQQREMESIKNILSKRPRDIKINEMTLDETHVRWSIEGTKKACLTYIVELEKDFTLDEVVAVTQEEDKGLYYLSIGRAYV